MSESELMTVEEVARYLRVSERTVYDWAHKGEIPCGKLGTAWRFRKSEVDKWIDQHMNSNSHNADPETTALPSILQPDGVAFLEGGSKHQVLSFLLERLSTYPQVGHLKELTAAIFQREALMSTGLGLGVAIPHVRLASVEHITMVAGRCLPPVEDYESLDGRPVSLIFMVAAGQNEHAEHLKLLSLLSTRFKDEHLRNELLAAPTPETFRSLLIRGSVPAHSPEP